MTNFSTDQLKALSSFFNNTAVAWSTAGVIIPTFSHNVSPTERVLYYFIGISVALFFLWVSLRILREIE